VPTRCLHVAHRSLASSFAAALALAALAATAAADTWTTTGPPLVIKELEYTVQPLTVDGDFKIRDLDVIVSISHPDSSQLSLTLRSPDGHFYDLCPPFIPGSGFTHTVFDDEAPGPITAGVPPFTGRYKPKVPLQLLDDKAASGTWMLYIADQVAGQTGTLDEFSLAFNGVTAVATDGPQPISSAGPATSTLTVPDDITIADAEVTLTLAHPVTSDLTVTLHAPAGPDVLLVQGIGGAATGCGFLGTTLDDEAPLTLQQASLPAFTGRFVPSPGPTLAALDGSPAAGAWTLEVVDDQPAGDGVLQAWSLHLVPVPTCGNVASATSYGAGLAGTNDFVPVLKAEDPVLGEFVAVTVMSSSLVTSPALVLAGVAPASVPFKGGTLLVDPLILKPLNDVYSIGFVFSFKLPDDASLCGQHVYLQFIAKDQNAPQGIAISKGLDLTLGS